MPKKIEPFKKYKKKFSKFKLILVKKKCKYLSIKTLHWLYGKISHCLIIYHVLYSRPTDSGLFAFCAYAVTP